MMLVKVVSVPANSKMNEMITKRSLDICFICGNRGINQSYHRIPAKSPTREKWLEALKIDEYHANIRVCSIHFRKEDFRKLTENRNKILYRNAVPSKLLTVSFSQSKLFRTMSQRSAKTCCCVCGARDLSLSYHRFPSEPNLKKKWAVICGFEDENFVTNKRICGSHFRPEDFSLNQTVNINKRMLKKNVVPTLSLHGTPHARKNEIRFKSETSNPAPINKFILKDLNDIHNITIPATFTPEEDKIHSTAKPETQIFAKNLVFKNLNDAKNMIPTRFVPITPVSGKTAISSSLRIVQGKPKTKRKRTNLKTKKMNVSSTKPTVLIDSNSTLDVEILQANSPEVIELSADGDDVIDNETNTILAESNSFNSKLDDPKHVSQSDNEDSNFSIESLILEEASTEENENSSNFEDCSRPTQTILPAPSNSVVNTRPVETTSVLHNLIADHNYKKKGFPTDYNYKKDSSNFIPPLLWRYPSDIGPSHCNDPINAWKAVQFLQLTIKKQRRELGVLQQFKRRTTNKMQKMHEEIESLRREMANPTPVLGPDEVEPWWV